MNALISAFVEALAIVLVIFVVLWVISRPLGLMGRGIWMVMKIIQLNQETDSEKRNELARSIAYDACHYGGYSREKFIAQLNRSGIDKKTVDAILVEFDREKGTRKRGVEG